MHSCYTGNGQNCFLSILEKIIWRYGIQQQHKGLDSYFKKYLDWVIIKYTEEIGIYWKIPWRREWQPTPVFLPGEFHGQRSLAGYSPMGHVELDTTERLTHINMHMPPLGCGILVPLPRIKPVPLFWKQGPGPVSWSPRKVPSCLCGLIWQQ